MPTIQLLIYRFSLLLLLLYTSGCQKSPPVPLPESVLDVLPLLKSRVDLRKSYAYLSDLTLANFEKKLNSNPRQKPPFLLAYAESLLNNGKTDEAISVLKEIPTNGTPEFNYKLDRLLAIAYLRMGEQKNCIGTANPAACLFPLQNEGVYFDKMGPTLAINLLSKCLATVPEDLEIQWLLRLAYMALGQYPDALPNYSSPSNNNYISKDSIGQFEDQAVSMGLTHIGLSGGVIMDDFNNDGALDIMLSEVYFERQLRFYLNDGQGHFTDQTEVAGLNGQTGGLNIIQADYNNDGWLDFFILRGAWFAYNGQHPNSLLKNNGDGTFTDVTVEAGLYSLYPTQSGVWGDFNRDGWIDLIIANESNKFFESPIEFFVNNGDGTFTDQAEAAGLHQKGFFKGITLTDIENDLWPDIFISHLNGESYLLKNKGLNKNGDIYFSDVSADADIKSPRKSFPCWAWDYDNDGYEDLATAPYSFNHKNMYEELLGQPVSGGESMGIYHNNGDGTYTNVNQSIGLDKPYYSMAGNFDDFDNDGFLDIYLGTGSPNMGTLVPNRMIRNKAGQTFEDITYSANVGHLQKGHSIAIGDIDNDGDQDIYAVMGGIFIGDLFQNAMFINPGQGNNWINLKLIGTQANKSAIGSRIELTLMVDGKERKIYRRLSSGGSFGASSLQQEIGLATADTIQKLTVTWAGSGTIEHFKNIKVNTAYQIEEGKGELEIRNLDQTTSKEEKQG